MIVNKRASVSRLPSTYFQPKLMINNIKFKTNEQYQPDSMLRRNIMG